MIRLPINIMGMDGNEYSLLQLGCFCYSVMQIFFSFFSSIFNLWCTLRNNFHLPFVFKS